MSKNIWIWNHYATSMYFNAGGRHYYFAKNLIENGYSPTIFCASTNHETDNDIIIDKGLFKESSIERVPFVFVKSLPYKINNYKRILNMSSFYINLIKVAHDYAKKNGKPDVILASSVHPLTLKAGIKIAKEFNIPCITEVRDLWPESLVAYNIINKNSPLTKLLYKNEKKIYEQSNAIIMSWPGGKQYLVDKGWTKTIDLQKVHHISNGIILQDFKNNLKEFPVDDVELTNNEYFNITYTGSIRTVNNLGLILDTAKIIQEQNSKIRFLIYGSGDQEEKLKERCKEENIKNVIFKGRVDKKYIPSIITKAYANLLHNSSTSLDKYGQSQNKLFEYLAAGKPIIQTYQTAYSILDKYNCGITTKEQNPKLIASEIISLCDDENSAQIMGNNAIRASKNYDFTLLTKKLINIIEQL